MMYELGDIITFIIIAIIFSFVPLILFGGC